MFRYIAVLLAIVAVAAAAAPRCRSGSNNTIPINTAAPELIDVTTNGKRYTAGKGDDTFDVVHVWGTPYEQGVAHGKLRAEAIKAIPPRMYTYIEKMITENVPKWIPKWIIDIIGTKGAAFMLQLTWKWTKPFSPQSYIDELQGIADGSGVPLEDVVNYNMFPELTKAACTIVGANGQATPDGKIAHLRGLDIDATTPIKDYAQITVYHSDKGPNVANFGWAGMVGSLTGISDTRIGIGEKVWLGGMAKNMSIDGVQGQPWMSILRDVLVQPNLDSALSVMRNANRTCAIHVGVGDSTTNEFRGVTMAQKAFVVYNDTSINYPQHPILPGIVYWDKHSQPDTSHWCLSDLLKQYYGAITAKDLAVGIAATGETGDFHTVSFDYENLIAYFANSRKTFVTTGNLNAYARQFTRVDVGALFKVAK